MKKYLRVNEAAAQLKVSAQTLRRYSNDGLIPHTRTPTGQRVFSQNDIDDFIGKEKSSEQKKAYYARTSDNDKNRMENQINALKATYGDDENNLIIKDVGSGLNDRRKGLQRLIKLSQNQEITDIYITQQDRLTRFGYSYLEALFSQNGVSVHIINSPEDKTLQDELLQDFMSLIASFSGKFYRLRGYEQQKKLLEKAVGEIDGKQEAN